VTTSTLDYESRMLIDGELVGAAGGARFDNVNPSTGEVIGSVSDAGPAEMEQAIESARRAFDTTSWSIDRDLRRRCLIQFRDALFAERESLRAELVAELGCTITSTYSNRLDLPIDRSFDWPIEMIDAFPWERDEGSVIVGGRSTSRRVRKEAMGVIGAIIPWNSPIELALAKVIPALATGNTVVLKPAPDTPFSATRIARAAAATELPAGVLNIVLSSDHLLGEQLSTDPRVDMISFTGSVETGRRIMSVGGPTLKRLQLELGGKSPHVVLDDADLVSALPLFTSVCLNAGQSCGALSRLLIPRSRYDETVELLVEAFRAVQVGPPEASSSQLGPLVSGRQRERVLGYIEQGKASGARMLVGGGIPSDLPDGFYVEPTLFVDVDNGSRIAQEEIFGPVLSVIPYEGDDEAVGLANDSPYGLLAAVSSASEERAMAIAGRIRAGAVAVNQGSVFARDVPFGGYKQSGIGRQNGLEGFEEMLETKTIGIGDAA